MHRALQTQLQRWPCRREIYSSILRQLHKYSGAGRVMGGIAGGKGPIVRTDIRAAVCIKRDILDVKVCVMIAYLRLSIIDTQVRATRELKSRCDQEMEGGCLLWHLRSRLLLDAFGPGPTMFGQCAHQVCTSRRTTFRCNCWR